MKKVTILLAVAASAFAMASCGGGDEPVKPGSDLVKNVSGGSAEEREAIQTCVKKSIATVSGSTTILIGGSYDLQEDNGDFLSLATSWNTKVASGKKYNVDIEWDVGTSDFINNVSNPDASHKMVEFNYPGADGENGTYSFSIKSLKCGGASTTNPEVTYSCNVKKATYYHRNVHISDLYKTKDLEGGKIGYAIADYEKNPTFWVQQEENKGRGEQDGYYYVNCYGKMLYTSPDGNWGLIYDGENVMELFSGKTKSNIKPSSFPAMNNGYVSVVGNMAHYYGNMQISFIYQVKKASASDLEFPDAEPTYREITGDLIKSIKNEFGGHSQCVKGVSLHNSLAKMSATYVPNSLKGSDGKATTKDKISSGARFTFDIKVGDEIVTVAYDYHSDQDGTHGVFDAIKTMVDAEGTFEVKGTLRYHGDDSNPFVQTETIPGDYQIVPFLADHVVAK